jgi:hypothetical protein
MSSPFDMITHSPIMQLANLARAGQNPMGLIQQLSGQNAPIMQGLNLIQGKSEAQLRTMAQNLFQGSSYHSFFAFYCFLTTFYHLGRYSMQSFFALHL